MTMKKILIIEDEKQLRETLTEILEINNYQVLSADNGIEGCRIAIKEIPDLIISDISMPKMDGFEVLQKLKESMSEQVIPPFMYLTAKVDRPDIRKGMKLGAEDYITKPFAASEILEAIESILENRDQLQHSILSTERERMSNELHNELQPLMVVAKMGLNHISNRIGLSEEDKNTFDKSLSYVGEAIDKSRLVARELIVEKDQKKDFGTFLRELSCQIASSGNIKFLITNSFNGQLHEKLESDIIQIVRELVINALKYADAGQIELKVKNLGEALQIEVNDDGGGFDVSGASHGLGLNSTRKLVQKLKGTFDIQSEINEGTKCSITIPLEPDYQVQ